MTSVNVTAPITKVTVNGSTSVVTATTAGPQGPPGPAGSEFILDQAAKVDKSIVYYDSASGEFKADATWTIETVVLGGNF